LVWGENGLVAGHLPEATPDSTRRSFLLRVPDGVESSPPDFVAYAIAGIRELLEGRPVDLHDIPIDIARVPEFDARA
jgi:methylated-DNA-[protein]-cysteine S-methyltransferase